MTATLNGRACAEVRATLPRYGVGTAWVTLTDADALPAGPGALTLNVAGLLLVGTVEKQGERAGLRSVEMMCGYGGWLRAVEPAGFQADNLVSVESYARALALATGERFLEADLRAYSLVKLGPTVARLGGIEAGALLSQALALATGEVVPWWVQPDGVTRLGARTGAAVTADKIDSDDTGRAIVYALEDATPLLPGATIDGLVVDELRITATGDSVREVAIVTGVGEDEETIGAKLRRIVLWIVGPYVSAARVYRYVVREVFVDGRIRCTPVKALLAPTLDRVRYWPGLAGGRAVPQVGSEILIQFADGDHRAPVVVAFQPAVSGGAGIPTRVEVDGTLVRLASASTAPAVARVSDTCTALAQDSVTGTVYYRNGGAWAPIQQVAGAPTLLDNGTAVTILTGSSKVQAG